MYVSSFHVYDELLDTDYNNCCLSHREYPSFPHTHKHNTNTLHIFKHTTYLCTC